MPDSPHPIIENFLEYLAFQKRYSKHTLLAYENDLSAFFGFASAEYGCDNPADTGTPIVRSWLASMKEAKLSSRTVNRKISSLKAFFKYQMKLGKIKVNPAAGVSSLKVSKRLPSFVDEQSIQTLLSNDFFADSFEGKTAHLVVDLLYQTGIRRSELINLKESDVHPSSGTIRVLGKGNKERIIPVNKHLLAAIEAYLSEKRAVFPGSAIPELLAGKKGKPLNPRQVYTIVKHYLSLVSTNQRKSPHVLRHTFATHLTNNGAEINAIKELLGHSSLAATQIYTHNTIDKLKKVHQQAHPKS